MQNTSPRETGGDFPGGPVVKILLANARVKGSIPGLGRSHMLGATKPSATTTGPTRPGAHALQQEKTLQ